MPSPPTQFFNRGVPLAELLEIRGAYLRLTDAKTITVTNAAALVFGEISEDTDAEIGLEYVALAGAGAETEGLLGVGLRYTGDAGAFQITAADATGAFTTPIALVTGETYWMVVPPDSAASAPNVFTVTALAADVGVAKAGTIAVIDQFNFSTMVGLRTLTTLTLSKTGAV